MRLLLLLLCSLASPAVGETLRMSIPQGYRQTTPELREGDWTTTEWRTRSQEERLRRMIGRGGAVVAPTDFRDSMESGPSARCTVGSIREGRDNGYAYALWAASCRSADAAGQLEETWTKAIQGRDALYVVQKAFTYNPFDRDVVKWVAYLERVQLCDPGLPDRPCRR